MLSGILDAAELRLGYDFPIDLTGTKDFTMDSTLTTIPVITLDGPAASGKGTIAERVGSALGFHYLDSGALYRIATLAALDAGIALEDEAALAELCRGLSPIFANGRIVVSGEDVTERIRSEEVSRATSRVAALPAVRRALFELQRRAARAPGLVADGRDMGTVVFPEARLKVFMTASARVRAERRYKQLAARGVASDLDELTRDLEERDRRDRERATAPLRPAEDARVLDTSDMNVEEVVKKVLDWWSDASKLS